MKNKLRLILWEDCPRSCPGCCNNDFDIQGLPKISFYDLYSYDEIFLTGGEPMMHPDRLLEMLYVIATCSDAEIYVYTAKIDDLLAVVGILHACDGLTVTLHEQEDVKAFLKLNAFVNTFNMLEKSLRLNVFEGVKLPIPPYEMEMWKVKKDIKWIKDCPLPEGETLMRW